MRTNKKHHFIAREHNRIVDQLPQQLPEQRKFDIARQVVISISEPNCPLAWVARPLWAGNTKIRKPNSPD